MVLFYQIFVAFLKCFPYLEHEGKLYFLAYTSKNNPILNYFGTHGQLHQVFLYLSWSLTMLYMYLCMCVCVCALCALECEYAIKFSLDLMVWTDILGLYWHSYTWWPKRTLTADHVLSDTQHTPLIMHVSIIYDDPKTTQSKLHMLLEPHMAMYYCKRSLLYSWNSLMIHWPNYEKILFVEINNREWNHFF